jgi:hypothetical protein
LRGARFLQQLIDILRLPSDGASGKDTSEEQQPERSAPSKTIHRGTSYQISFIAN